MSRCSMPTSAPRTSASRRATTSPGSAAFARRGHRVSGPSEGPRDDRQPIDRRGLRVLALDLVGVEVDVAANHIEGRMAEDLLEAEQVATVEQVELGERVAERMRVGPHA